MPRGIPSPPTWDASPRGFIKGQAPGKLTGCGNDFYPYGLSIQRNIFFCNKQVSSKRFVRLQNSCLSAEVVDEKSSLLQGNPVGLPQQFSWKTLIQMAVTKSHKSVFPTSERRTRHLSQLLAYKSFMRYHALHENSDDSLPSCG